MASGVGLLDGVRDPPSPRPCRPQPGTLTSGRQPAKIRLPSAKPPRSIPRSSMRRRFPNATVTPVHFPGNALAGNIFEFPAHTHLDFRSWAPLTMARQGCFRLPAPGKPPAQQGASSIPPKFTVTSYLGFALRGEGRPGSCPATRVLTGASLSMASAFLTEPPPWPPCLWPP